MTPLFKMALGTVLKATLHNIGLGTICVNYWKLHESSTEVRANEAVSSLSSQYRDKAGLLFVTSYLHPHPETLLMMYSICHDTNTKHLTKMCSFSRLPPYSCISLKTTLLNLISEIHRECSQRD